MPNQITWIPQKTSPHGDFVADRFLSLLDRGSDHRALSEPELLVRETAQNSWDARLTSRATTVRMSFSIVSVPEKGPLRKGLTDFFDDFTRLNRSRRPDVPPLEILDAALKGPDLNVLYVRDVGTFGLGGPTDAGQVVEEVGSDRYVKFLLNIGDANTDMSAGGAFGLGRSVFWRMSECATVIVYSRYVTPSGPKSRLIGLSITGKFDHRNRRHTGRHWWTTHDEGQPISGGNADRWARRLGFEMYDGTETGTAVLVVSPKSTKGPDDLARAIAASIEYHLWPKYINFENRPRSRMMRFEVKCNGEAIPVRDRRRLQSTPLRYYIAALEESYNATAPSDVQGVVKSKLLEYNFRRRDHPRELGRLTTTVFATRRQQGPPLTDDSDEPEEGLEAPIRRAIEELGNKVALLRTPELIVTYVEMDGGGPEHAAVAGVFKSSEVANEFFRRSETSTHSEWAETVAPVGEKRIINRFHFMLQEALRSWYKPATQDRDDADDGTLPTGRLATRLGSWLTDLSPGEGNRDDDDDTDDGGGGGAGGGARGHRRVRLDISDPVLTDINGVVVNEWTVTFQHQGHCDLHLEVREADDDGRTTRQTTVSRGGRPTLMSISSETAIESAVGNRVGDTVEFPSAASDPNVPVCVASFNPTDFSETISVRVRAAFDDGTVPVLGAEISAHAGTEVGT